MKGLSDVVMIGHEDSSKCMVGVKASKQCDHIVVSSYGTEYALCRTLQPSRVSMQAVATKASAFESITQAPPDPILGVSEAFKADTSSDKLNLGVGKLRKISRLWQSFKELQRILKEKLLNERCSGRKFAYQESTAIPERVAFEREMFRTLICLSGEHCHSHDKLEKVVFAVGTSPCIER